MDNVNNDLSYVCTVDPILLPFLKNYTKWQLSSSFDDILLYYLKKYVKQNIRSELYNNPFLELSKFQWDFERISLGFRHNLVFPIKSAWSSIKITSDLIGLESKCIKTKVQNDFTLNSLPSFKSLGGYIHTGNTANYICWCPNVSSSNQILASFVVLESKHPEASYSEENKTKLRFIQIWDYESFKNSKMKPTLKYSILHEWGNVTSMLWVSPDHTNMDYVKSFRCKNNSFDLPQDLYGHLLLACTDRFLRIIPIPNFTNDSLDDGEIIKIDPNFVMTLGISISYVNDTISRFGYPTCVDWKARFPSKLVVGYSTGFVALYDLAFAQHVRYDHENHYLAPVFKKRVCTSSITSVAFSINWTQFNVTVAPNPQGLTNFTMDFIKDYHLPIDVFRSTTAFHTVLWPARGDILIGLPISMDGIVIKTVLTHDTITIPICKIECIAFSDALNSILIATQSGTLMVISLNHPEFIRALDESDDVIDLSRFVKDMRFYRYVSEQNGDIFIDCSEKHDLLELYENYNNVKYPTIKSIAVNPNVCAINWAAISLDCGIVHLTRFDDRDLSMDIASIEINSIDLKSIPISSSPSKAPTKKNSKIRNTSKNRTDRSKSRKIKNDNVDSEEIDPLDRILYPELGKSKKKILTKNRKTLKKTRNLTDHGEIMENSDSLDGDTHPKVTNAEHPAAMVITDCYSCDSSVTERMCDSTSFDEIDHQAVLDHDRNNCKPSIKNATISIDDDTIVDQVEQRSVIFIPGLPSPPVDLETTINESNTTDDSQSSQYMVPSSSLKSESENPVDFATIIDPLPKGDVGDHLPTRANIDVSSDSSIESVVTESLILGTKVGPSESFHQNPSKSSSIEDILSCKQELITVRNNEDDTNVNNISPKPEEDTVMDCSINENTVDLTIIQIEQNNLTNENIFIDDHQERHDFDEIQDAKEEDIYCDDIETLSAEIVDSVTESIINTNENELFNERIEHSEDKIHIIFDDSDLDVNYSDVENDGTNESTVLTNQNSCGNVFQFLNKMHEDILTEEKERQILKHNSSVAMTLNGVHSLCDYEISSEEEESLKIYSAINNQREIGDIFSIEKNTINDSAPQNAIESTSHTLFTDIPLDHSNTETNEDNNRVEFSQNNFSPKKESEESINIIEQHEDFKAINECIIENGNAPITSSLGSIQENQCNSSLPINDETLIMDNMQIKDLIKSENQETIRDLRHLLTMEHGNDPTEKLNENYMANGFEEHNQNNAIEELEIANVDSAILIHQESCEMQESHTSQNEMQEKNESNNSLSIENVLDPIEIIYENIVEPIMVDHSAIIFELKVEQSDKIINEEQEINSRISFSPDTDHGNVSIETIHGNTTDLENPDFIGVVTTDEGIIEDLTCEKIHDDCEKISPIEIKNENIEESESQKTSDLKIKDETNTFILKEMPQCQIILERIEDVDNCLVELTRITDIEEPHLKREIISPHKNVDCDRESENDEIEKIFQVDNLKTIKSENIVLIEKSACDSLLEKLDNIENPYEESKAIVNIEITNVKTELIYPHKNVDYDQNDSERSHTEEITTANNIEIVKMESFVLIDKSSCQIVSERSDVIVNSREEKKILDTEITDIKSENIFPDENIDCDTIDLNNIDKKIIKVDNIKGENIILKEKSAYPIVSENLVDIENPEIKATATTGIEVTNIVSDTSEIPSLNTNVDYDLNNSESLRAEETVEVDNMTKEYQIPGVDNKNQEINIVESFPDYKLNEQYVTSTKITSDINTYDDLAHSESTSLAFSPQQNLSCDVSQSSNKNDLPLDANSSAYTSPSSIFQSDNTTGADDTSCHGSSYSGSIIEDGVNKRKRKMSEKFKNYHQNISKNKRRTKISENYQDKNIQLKKLPESSKGLDCPDLSNHNSSEKLVEPENQTLISQEIQPDGLQSPNTRKRKINPDYPLIKPEKRRKIISKSPKKIENQVTISKKSEKYPIEKKNVSSEINNRSRSSLCKNISSEKTITSFPRLRTINELKSQLTQSKTASVDIDVDCLVKIPAKESKISEATKQDPSSRKRQRPLLDDKHTESRRTSRRLTGKINDKSNDTNCELLPTPDIDSSSSSSKKKQNTNMKSEISDDNSATDNSKSTGSTTKKTSSQDNWWNSRLIQIAWDDAKYKNGLQVIRGTLLDTEPVIGKIIQVRWPRAISKNYFPAIVKQIFDEN